VNGATQEQAIQERADFGIVRYANCWEDADLLLTALEPAPGKRILSIASAGDNALALAAAGAEVVAADLSMPQLACAELRIAAIRALDYDELLAFLGITEHAQRLSIYAKLRSDLSANAAAYWDANGATLAAGLIHGGKFEKYFHLFRKRVLSLIHSRAKVQELLQKKSRTERETFYEQRWNNRRWRWLFKIFFSRTVMGRLGRDPEFFRYVEGSVGERILARTRHALTELPNDENPFLQYIVTGNFRPALPTYLCPQKYVELRRGVERITLVQGPIDEVAKSHRDRGWDGFNLSDIFEYMGPELTESVYGRLLEHARPGARLAYWNMLVPRRRPDCFAERVESLDQLAADCFFRDRAFFYSAFVVEQVR
jgi:S-adenosylmethionine-diacylglycerol 3-amino-3-carboxypropyl transferase